LNEKKIINDGKGETQVVKQIELNEEFIKALPILKEIKNHGYDAYFVGGSVRDALLGLEVNDVDIATSAMPEEIKEIFTKTADVGIEHGTVMVLYEEGTYEVTTFRTESTYKDFRRPDSVSFVRSLKEDLKRRDFTINALAIDEEGVLFDYFNGQEDLENGVIKAVGDPEERFNEDALRMMRAIRFSAQLNFDIEENTLKAITHHARLLKKIAVERIHIEFIKMMCGNDRSKGIRAMIQTKLYEFCPGISSAKHALIFLVNGTKQLKNERQSWALLIHYMLYLHPKPEDYSISHFLKNWKSSNKVIQDVTTLVDGVQYRLENDVLSSWKVFQLGEELALEVEELMEHIGGDKKTQETKAVYESLPVKQRSELAITGNDVLNRINKTPGKWLGEIMDQMLFDVVENKVGNSKDELLLYIETNLSD